MPEAPTFPEAIPERSTHRLAPRLMLRDDDETVRARAAGLILAVLITAAFGFAILTYWAPAHSGVDQNGYLVGGKQLAKTGSTGLLPEHPLGFVGAMWVRVAETGVNYPKYPLGLSALYASSIWVFGDAPGGAGYTYAFLVSPIGSVLSVLGMYLLARQFAGVFASLAAMLLMGSSQVLLALANNPNSHASCLACVVWGIYLLVRFWQTASAWRGFAGGFLLGYAATIRYTDGLLALVIAIVGVSMVRWSDWRSYVRCAWPTIGWLVPVLYLAIFNLAAMGTLTGYDTTNESKFGSAFTWAHVTENWEKLIRQVHDSGLFFAVPIGMLGMFVVWQKGWRRATVLWAWLIPGTLIYMAYYWAPDRGVSYLRFFLTLLPPLAIGAAVVFDQMSKHLAARRFVATLACGGVLAIACGMSVHRAASGLEDGQETGLALETLHLQQANLAGLGQVVVRNAPSGSVVFAAPQQLHYLQFIGDYECFSPEYFTQSFAQRLQNTESKTDESVDPMTQQGERRRWLLSVVAGKSDRDLTAIQSDLMKQALQSGKRVFYVMNQRSEEFYTRRFSGRSGVFQTRVVARYVDQPRISREVKEETTGVDPARRWIRDRVRRFSDQPQSWRVIEVTLKPVASSGTAEAGVGR